MAFLWAVCIGGGLGAASLYRETNTADESNGNLAFRLPWLLERIELATFDWRAREAAIRAEPQEDVVRVMVDRETRDNARRNEHPDWATSPWSRSLIATATEQAVREGAARVIIQDSLRGPSFRQCGDSALRNCDDEALASALVRLGDSVVLGLRPASSDDGPTGNALAASLTKMGTVPSKLDRKSVV